MAANGTAQLGSIITLVLSQKNFIAAIAAYKWKIGRSHRFTTK